MLLLFTHKATQWVAISEYSSRFITYVPHTIFYCIFSPPLERVKWNKKKLALQAKPATLAPKADIPGNLNSRHTCEITVTCFRLIVAISCIFVFIYKCLITLILQLLLFSVLTSVLFSILLELLSILATFIWKRLTSEVFIHGRYTCYSQCKQLKKGSLNHEFI